MDSQICLLLGKLGQSLAGLDPLTVLLRFELHSCELVQRFRDKLQDAVVRVQEHLDDVLEGSDFFDFECEYELIVEDSLHNADS